MRLNIKSIRFIFPVAIVVSLLSVSLFLNKPAHAFDYTRLPNGQQGVKDELDTPCYNDYWAARNKKPAKTLKAVTNASAYQSQNWLSVGTETAKTNVDVTYGSTANINLRINHLDYICAVALKDGTDNIITIDTRMKAASSRDGHDDLPAPWQGYANSPNRTYYGFGLYGLSANTGSIKSGSFTTGAQIISARNDSSRFWMNGTSFTYVPPSGGLTTSQDVTITATIRNINQYYYRNDPKWGWEINCSGMKWNDNAGTNPGTHNSLPNVWFTDQCGDTTLRLKFHITVPIQYTLTPTVALSDTTASVGDTRTVDSTVSKSGSASNKTAWRVTKLVYKPKANLTSTEQSAQANASQNACDSFRSASRLSCDEFYSVDDKVFSSSSTVNNKNYSVENLAIGSTVCFVNSISKPTQDDSPIWSHSAMSCLVIGKKPHVQIWGGDLATGKAFIGGPLVKSVQASTSTNLSGNRFGSWVEYGIFASGSVTGAASASGYASGMAAATFCKASRLSFTLATGDSSCASGHTIGGYKANRSIPRVAVNFPVTGSTPILGANDLSNQSIRGVYTASGNLTLNGATIEKGRWLVLNAPGATVTINGDIRYTSSSLQSIGQIPQLVIIANKIIINDNVTNVDAWLIASGTAGIVETCNIDSSNYVLVGDKRLTSDKCNKQLIVNGPVMAKQLWLRRTAGSGIDATAAEVFNLRPDAYLWANARATNNGRIQTVHTTELPPRL